MLNGGPASLLYGTIFAGLGSTAIAMSLAEMASMYVLSSVLRSFLANQLLLRDPTVGAQYRWSAKFAPKYPRFFGLLQGKCLSAFLDLSSEYNLTVIQGG
jgi:choline transport protein